MIIRLIAGLIKAIPLYKINYYWKQESHIKNKITVRLYLSNYAIKATAVGTSEFAKTMIYLA